MLKLQNVNYPEVEEGHLIPDLDPVDQPETYREKYNEVHDKYDDLCSAIIDHFEGGPMPEAFAEHTKALL